MSALTSLEICSGAGGQALGLEMAGFGHEALVEIEPPACATLRLNRPQWNVIQGDLRSFDGRPYKGIDLLAGGVPCPPFSKAGKQLGADDERDLFPEAIRLVDECRPRAVMLENVRGLMDAVFDDYRNKVEKQLKKLGYKPSWRLLNASDYGVSQLRPRVIFVGIRKEFEDSFAWPVGRPDAALTVGELLHDLMAEHGWRGADKWRDKADTIAPTLVGGSKKHGGPDLGPTRAKRAWATLGVDGMGIADFAPAKSFVGMPRLTTRMTARIQGFLIRGNFPEKRRLPIGKLAMHFPLLSHAQWRAKLRLPSQRRGSLPWHRATEMDKISSSRRSNNMRAIKSKNTAPELLVRKLVHKCGFRYRLHKRELPGKPDLVFSSRKAAIFVHGCFWHAHGCRNVRVPKSNIEYWKPKLERNQLRDKAHAAALEGLGWRVLTIWECETTNMESLESKVRAFLESPVEKFD